MVRVFIGLVEIANLVSTYAKAFRSSGNPTYTVVLQKRMEFYPESNYDVVLDKQIGKPKASLAAIGIRLVKAWIISLCIFFKALVTCDVFIFVCGEPSLLPKHLDYPILKKFGKRIVIIFTGDDIRYWYTFRRDIRMLGLEREFQPFLTRIKSLPEGYLHKLEKIRAAERYGDLILSQPDFGQLQTRPYMRLNVPLDLAKYRFHVPNREVPLVVHAPSDPFAKGTQYILKVVDQLHQEGIRFNFRLIEKMPNSQLLEVLQDADIVIDQLFSLTVATQALESMATGNVVLTNYPDASYSHVPAGCPAVKVTRYTLARQLRRVILNRKLRQQLAYAGREYVEKNHSGIQIARQILEWLRPGGIRQYDFSPSRTNDRLALPEELYEFEVAKWTRYRDDRTGARLRIPSGLKWLLWPITHMS